MTKRPTVMDILITAPQVATLTDKIQAWAQDNSRREEYMQDALDLLHTPNSDGYQLAKHLEDYEGYDPDEALVDVLSCVGMLQRAARVELIKQWVKDNNLTIPESALDTQVSWKYAWSSIRTGWIVSICQEEYRVTINEKAMRNRNSTFQPGFHVNYEDIIVPATT